MLKLYYKIINANRSTIITYFAIFLAIFAVFGAFAGEVRDTTSFVQKRASIAVLDNDKSELSKIVVKQLGIDTDIADVGSTMEEMKDALFFAQVNVIVEIPKGFQEKFEAGEQHIVEFQFRPDHGDGVLVQQSLNSYLASVHSYTQIDETLSYKEVGKLVKKDLKNKVKTETVSGKEETSGDGMRIQFYNFLSYVLFSVIVMSAGAAMHTIYRSEMLKRTLIAPINSTKINIKIVVGNISFALILLLMFNIVVFFMSDSMFSTSGLLLVLNSIVYTLVCISFTYMITTLITNKKNGKDKLDMISNIVGLMMSFLCGAFLPISFIPESVLQVAKFLPAYWYVKLNESMLTVTNVTNDLFKTIVECMGIQLLFAIAFIVIGLVVMKHKRTQGEIIDSDHE